MLDLLSCRIYQYKRNSRYLNMCHSLLYMYLCILLSKYHYKYLCILLSNYYHSWYHIRTMHKMWSMIDNMMYPN